MMAATTRVRDMSSPWLVESLDGGVTRITFEHRLWVLVTSDWHWDSTHCDRDKLASDLQLAKKYNAAVLSLGDHFDVMGGKYDPRSNGKHDIRPELQQGNYFDEVIRQGAKWLAPWRDQMALITPGNHETAVRKRQETCLTTRLVERLRSEGGRVRQAGYAGWILFRGRKGSKNSSVFRMWYHHGFGGGGPVTRGVIDYSRYMVNVDADAIVAGHVHQRTLMESMRERISSNGLVEVKPVFLVRSSTYKNESLTDGWHVERGMAARPQGGWWLCLRWDKTKSKIRGTFHDSPAIEGD
jgi:hypothetical protein